MTTGHTFALLDGFLVVRGFGILVILLLLLEGQFRIHLPDLAVELSVELSESVVALDELLHRERLGLHHGGHSRILEATQVIRSRFFRCSEEVCSGG